MQNFTNQEACSYLLSLSHISTINGKLDLICGVLLFTLAIFANVLLVYGMIKAKEIKTITSKLLLALGVTDLVIGPGLIVFHLVIVNLETTYENSSSCELYTSEQFLTVFLATASTLFTFFMSLDRTVSIKRTFWYADINDRYPIFKILVFATYTSAAGSSLATILIYSKGGMYNTPDSTSNEMRTIGLSIFVPLLVMYAMLLGIELTMNFLLIQYINKQADLMRKYQQDDDIDDDVKTSRTVWYLSSSDLKKPAGELCKGAKKSASNPTTFTEHQQQNSTKTAGNSGVSSGDIYHQKSINEVGKSTQDQVSVAVGSRGGGDIDHQKSTKAARKSAPKQVSMTGGGFRYHEKATKTVLVISFVQISTTLPLVVSFARNIVLLATDQHEEKIEHLYYATNWLRVPVIMNSMLNAVVFVGRNQKIRMFYKKGFFRVFKSQQ